jgi:hypothetical protein
LPSRYFCRRGNALAAAGLAGSRQNTKNRAAIERDFARTVGIAGKLGVFDEFGSFRIVRSTAQNLANVASSPRNPKF